LDQVASALHPSAQPGHVALVDSEGLPQLALGHASGFPRRFEQDHERVGMGDRYGMAAGCLIAREKPGGPYEGLDQKSQVRRFGVRGWQGSRPRVNGS
jgi:hypothetical protein